MTAYHEAAGYRSLVLALSLLELIASSPPSRPRFGTIHGGFQQIATTDVQLLPKELDEKVVKLHFPALGAELTVLTREQAFFMVVEAQGPFKDPH